MYSYLVLTLNLVPVCGIKMSSSTIVLLFEVHISDSCNSVRAFLNEKQMLGVLITSCIRGMGPFWRISYVQYGNFF
jgi:hypothetical protein